MVRSGAARIEANAGGAPTRGQSCGVHRHRFVVAVIAAATAASLLVGAMLALLVSAAAAQTEPNLLTDSTLEFTVGPRQQPTVGALVTWDYEVANKSAYKFTDLVVEDAREGRVCLITELDPGETRTCSLPTMAGVIGYETTASVAGTPVTSDGSILPPLIAKVKRTYFVLEDPAPAPPNDLAFSDPPPLPDGTTPDWPVDRWGPYVIATALVTAVIITLVRKGPTTHRGVKVPVSRKPTSRN